MAHSSEHTVLAGDCETRYVDAGSGETVLLLHSVDPGCSGTLEYRENIDALSKRFRVVVPDLMGFGGSSLPKGGVKELSETYTNHILGFMHALDLQRVHLVGNSRGGLIAISIAEQYPDKVSRIILLANAGGAVTKEYLEKQRAAYGNFRPNRESMRGFLSGSYFSLDRDMTPAVFDEYCRNADAQYARYDAIGGLPASSVPDLRPQLAKAKHPILYVFGANDERWPPAPMALEIFLTTPGSRFYMVSRCGHHPQTEAPTELNLLMAAFLSGDMGV
jgi:2-hydroxy-6-oxo-octa-2,4-dienoate hydrolase